MVKTITLMTVVVVSILAQAAPAATLSSIQIKTPPSTTLLAGQDVQLTATGTYSDGTTADITAQVAWSVSNTAVVKVSPAGLVSTLESGGGPGKPGSPGGGMPPGDGRRQGGGMRPNGGPATDNGGGPGGPERPSRSGGSRSGGMSSQGGPGGPGARGGPGGPGGGPGEGRYARRHDGVRRRESLRRDQSGTGADG